MPGEGVRHPPAYLMESPPAARTLINGRWRDYFSGCGYLGLQGHPGLVAAAAEALQRYGLTTATSRGGYGEHPVYQALEESAARFLGAERATAYVSAYLGSNILLEGLAGEYERIFIDDAAHFSVRQAAQAAGKPVHPFRHCDGSALAAALRSHLLPHERPFVLTDGVFPISGEIAPLPDYLAALGSYEGALLGIDDAHATGAIGARGRGTLEHWLGSNPALLSRSSSPRVCTAHTLSKALGGHGGVIAGDAAFMEKLGAKAAALTASSPSPIPAAAASAWALDYAREHPELRARLWANVARARAGFRALGWPLDESPAPIVCLPAVRSLSSGRFRQQALPPLDLARLRDELFARDICVAHVTRYSSTPAGGALRVAVFASHSEEQIDRLLETAAGLV